ncbi:hypothetical protein LCGC14_2934650 [marine sediment metagenome]|uniref:Uncharacterized protein n=1 Tax=marine sediment metagenome TaxID=412755 RepID=A0A0F8XKG4_9ZZZZ
MGQIVIRTEGSFPYHVQIIESARYGGHAAAIGRAIKELTSMLPEAIALDHKLAKKGSDPDLAEYGYGP